MLVELARRTRDDARVHRPVVARELRAVDVVQLPEECRVVLLGVLVLDQLLANAVEVGAEPCVLPLRVDEAAEVAVDVAERLGDALGTELERPQHGRARRLDPVDGARGRRAERHRNQDQREQDEHPDNGPPPEG